MKKGSSQPKEITFDDLIYDDHLSYQEPYGDTWTTDGVINIYDEEEKTYRPLTLDEGKELDQLTKGGQSVFKLWTNQTTGQQVFR
jgi:hypothetical protein